MISVINLSKNYNTPQGTVHALKEVNLSVNPGEIFGIIGRSGAGKSSLVKCINMLERPTSGEVIVDGLNFTKMDLAELRRARRHLGMIFQHFNLLESRTVYENVSLPLEIAGVNNSKRKSIIDNILDLTELGTLAKKYPKTLSGGQKQRVAIARALSNSPKVLLSDEATSALDPKSTQQIFELLRSIRQELNLTILVITHEMDVVKTVCDKVAVIHEGQIIEQGNVLDVFTYPENNITKDLISASIKVDVPKSIAELMLAEPNQSGNYSSIIRISYKGEATSQPIIGYIIQQYNITINIIQANIETIQNHTVGIMIVEISGYPENVSKSIAFLERNELRVEILGYLNK